MAASKKETIKIRKKLQAVVVGIVDEKTVKVKVERKYQHPFYGKILKAHKLYLVHCEEALEEGEKIFIEEGKPVSKRKSFYFIEKVS